MNQSPFLSLLSLDVRKLDYGHCMLEINLEDKHLNPFGELHGGVYSSAIDTVTYWASYCSVPEDQGLISLDLHVDNISTSKGGKLIVEGKQIKSGETVCIAVGTVKDVDGKLLAHGTSKQIIKDGLQTVNQAIDAMGHAPLPPKYID
jgi:uncharacterized protein (TIGR00369 family)